MASFPAVVSLDAVSLVATITQLVDERQRLRGELALVRYHAEVQSKAAAYYAAQVSQLSSQITSLQMSLQSILCLQHVVSDQRMPDEAHAEDEEESILELYELRRWKQQFAVEQTRSVFDRVEELTAEVHRLETIVRAFQGDK